MRHMLLGSNGMSKEEYINDPAIFPVYGWSRDPVGNKNKIVEFNKKYSTDISFYTAYHTRAINSGSYARTDDRLSGYNGGNGPLSGRTQYYEFKICNYGKQKVYIKFDGSGEEILLKQGEVMHKLWLDNYYYSPPLNFRLYIA
ncbi:hypothetical protein CHL10071_08540 [Campylobacter hyointestinalis subsp. lawsonii]|nr:hypothetical protein CHL10071_08540 [Campylobacter hyointestinalis subsp. lawsonii]